MHRRSVLALAGVPLLSAAQPRSAEAYPRAPIRLVVPFPAGSSTDALGREVGQFMARSLAQPWVIDNKPGALATLGSAEVARARPDGYTLLLGTSTSHAAAPSLFKKLAYDPLRDFTPIGRIGAVNFALVVRSDHPAATVEQLIELVRRKGAQPLSWAYANSANRVAGAELVRHAGLDAIAVPYKGVPQIMVDILGRQIDFTIADLPSVLPQIRAGKMRALAVTSPREAAELPGVPPLSRTVGGFTLLGWYALFAPAGTPAPVQQLLSEHLQRGLAMPDVQKRIETAGLMPYPADSAELTTYIASETAKWAALVKTAGIEAE
jgi:tripartite-type tricarboxylate transporter receptor subunit TctC